MTEVELAQRLGLSRPYVNAVACGKKNVTVSQLERMAQALGMRLHIAFDDDGGGPDGSEAERKQR